MKALDQAVRAGIRSGDNTAERGAGEALRTLVEDLAAARKREKAAKFEIGTVDTELLIATGRLRAQLRARAVELGGDIERRVGSDKKLRTAIIEALALHVAAEAGQQGITVNWAGHLTGVFEHPSDSELASAVAAARERLGVA